MNKNRVERTSTNELAGQVQENASELVRSVGDVAGKFIQEQPFTATLIALGIGWLLGRMHRPLYAGCQSGSLCFRGALSLLLPRSFLAVERVFRLPQGFRKLRHGDIGKPRGFLVPAVFLPQSETALAAEKS